MAISKPNSSWCCQKPQSPNSTTSKVKVTVSIHEGEAHLSTASGTLFPLVKYSMLRRNFLLVEEEGTMRLLALRWSVAGALEGENMKRARTTGSFQRQTSEGWSNIPTTHQTLADIADGKQEVNLRLVLS